MHGLQDGVALCSERRAQDSMTRDHRLQRIDQSGLVEPAVDAKSPIQVVGGRQRIHLMDEPQTALQFAEMRGFAGRTMRELGRRGAVAGSLRRDCQPKPLGPGCGLLRNRHACPAPGAEPGGTAWADAG